MQLTREQIFCYWEARHPGQRITSSHRTAVRCALHAEDNPSCTLFLNGAGGFNCHGCGAKGGLVAFEMAFSQCDREQAEDNIARITGAKPVEHKSVGSPTAIYDYRDEAAILLYQKRRYEKDDGGKTFKIFRQTEPGWEAKIDRAGGPKTRRVLYNLPAVIAANTVIVTEGEKDADNIAAARLFQDSGLKVASTTSFDGAWQPGKKPKWLDDYNRFFSGKMVFILHDNDAPGIEYANHIARSIAPFAFEVRIVTLPGLGEGGDVSDYLSTHSAKELEEVVKAAPKWIAHQDDEAPVASLWDAQDMTVFLNEEEDEIEWLVPGVIAPGCLTEFFAPRGIGKSLLADYWAVTLAKAGKRVLILDRDNARRTLCARLRGFGADGMVSLKAMSREQCPPLTDAAKWSQFPYEQYDLVIVDSLNAMAEGVGEQDSAAPARVMAALLDICHRENGPAVLLLGNTVKNGAHGRGSGVVEDRADIVYEVRDATDFRPSGKVPWIVELPEQGAADWKARSARRKEKTRLRLALVPTKFRDDSEPAPRMLEICTEPEIWTVTDVTASVDAEGEADRQDAASAKITRIANGCSILLGEIDDRAARGEPPILKTQAEELLKKAGYTRTDARKIIAHDGFVEVKGEGSGHPKELHRQETDATAESSTTANANTGAAIEASQFCRPLLTGTAELHSALPLVNTDYLQLTISATDQIFLDQLPQEPVSRSTSSDAGWFDLEV